MSTATIAAGSRLYRENMVSSSHSELYHANNPTAGTEYDGLGKERERKGVSP